MKEPFLHYRNLIAEVDRLLDLVRILWMDTPLNSAEWLKYRGRIDQLLDERIKLMNLRDALEIKAA